MARKKKEEISDANDSSEEVKTEENDLKTEQPETESKKTEKPKEKESEEKVSEEKDSEEKDSEEKGKKAPKSTKEKEGSAKKDKKAKESKGRKRRKAPKIDVNKSPKLKKVLQEAERLEDINELKDLRDNHNNATRDLINRIKKIQVEISNIRTQALDYRNKRDELNKRVQEVKNEKTAILEGLNGAKEDYRTAKAESKNSEESKNRKAIHSTIGKIKRRIESLERKIETEDLELKDENHIVDEIDNLERQLQELQKQNVKPKSYSQYIEKISANRMKLKEINSELRTAAEESQNYHLLYLDTSKEMEDLRNDKRQLQKDLNENRYIADIYHQRLIECSQKLNKQKRISQKAQYQNKRKIKKEIQKITLEDAKNKLKKGVKLNIFEARAFLEDQANSK